MIPYSHHRLLKILKINTEHCEHTLVTMVTIQKEQPFATVRLVVTELLVDEAR
jgi:hypothetical protein